MKIKKKPNKKKKEISAIKPKIQKIKQEAHKRHRFHLC